VWLRILNREIPLRAEAHWKEDLTGVIQLADRRKIRLVLLGATELGRLKNPLKGGEIPVILGAPASLLSNDLDRVHATEGIAKDLASRDVPFAFCTAGEAMIRYDSLTMISEMHGGDGLSMKDQLFGLTSGAAAALGMSDSLGRIESGYRSVLQVRKGSSFDARDRVSHMVFGTNVIELGDDQ
jgi:imidazolonepropionase-like amidohydrolase